LSFAEKELLSDELVIRRIITEKDTASFGLLYDRYADKVFAKCMSFAHDTQQAEDLAHDIFLKVYLKLGEFRFEAKFSTWLYSITYHECVEYTRKVKKNTGQQEQYRAEQEAFESADSSDAELLELKIGQLEKLLNKISPEDKALVLMKYQDGLSVQEIMNHTQLGESAVKMRLKRTKDRLVTLSRDLVITLMMLLMR
jgi:RNA polymerase sigma-70 factor (ECF subfamily)